MNYVETHCNNNFIFSFEVQIFGVSTTRYDVIPITDAGDGGEIIGGRDTFGHLITDQSQSR